MSEPTPSHPIDDRCDPALIRVLRAQSPSARLATLDSMWRSALALVRCGVTAQHPDWPEARIAAETARRMAGGTQSNGRH
jgi:hypothetical protein